MIKTSAASVYENLLFKQAAKVQKESAVKERSAARRIGGGLGGMALGYGAAAAGAMGGFGISKALGGDGATQALSAMAGSAVGVGALNAVLATKARNQYDKMNPEQKQRAMRGYLNPTLGALGGNPAYYGQMVL